MPMLRFEIEAAGLVAREAGLPDSVALLFHATFCPANTRLRLIRFDPKQIRPQAKTLTVWSWSA